jgi:hypothetical protein
MMYFLIKRFTKPCSIKITLILYFNLYLILLLKKKLMLNIIGWFEDMPKSNERTFQCKKLLLKANCILNNFTLQKNLFLVIRIN